MSRDQEILTQMLEESGALRRGHFLLSSGLHSEAYVQCALLLEEPVRARQVGRELAEMLARQFGIEHTTLQVDHSTAGRLLSVEQAGS